MHDVQISFSPPLIQVRLTFQVQFWQHFVQRMISKTIMEGGLGGWGRGGAGGGGEGGGGWWGVEVLIPRRCLEEIRRNVYNIKIKTETELNCFKLSDLNHSRRRLDYARIQGIKGHDTNLGNSSSCLWHGKDYMHITLHDICTPLLCLIFAVILFVFLW